MIRIEIDTDSETEADIALALEAVLQLMPYESIVFSGSEDH